MSKDARALPIIAFVLLLVGVFATVAGTIYTFAPAFQDQVCEAPPATNAPTDAANKETDPSADPTCRLVAPDWRTPLVLAAGITCLASLVALVALWAIRRLPDANRK